MLLLVPTTAHCQTQPSVALSYESQPEIFPRSWRENSIAATAEGLSEELQATSRAVVEEELAKYPAPLLRRNVRRIYILGELGFRGVKASGTNSRRNVYLAYHGGTRDPGDHWFRRVLHSELSSIFLRNYREDFPEESWRAVLPTDFQYGQGGVSAVREKQTGDFFQDALLTAGFVGRYAQSSLENDFNAVAGQLFIGSDALWEAVARFPAIAQKVDLSIGFYQGLNPMLDRRYFESLRVSRLDR